MLIRRSCSGFLELSAFLRWFCSRGGVLFDFAVRTLGGVLIILEIFGVRYVVALSGVCDLDLAFLSCRCFCCGGDLWVSFLLILPLFFSFNRRRPCAVDVLD
jgi:hypothetical protein